MRTLAVQLWMRTLAVQLWMREDLTLFVELWQCLSRECQSTVLFDTPRVSLAPELISRTVQFSSSVLRSPCSRCGLS